MPDICVNEPWNSPNEQAAILLIDQILKGEPVNIPGANLATGDLAQMGNTGVKMVKTYILDVTLVTRNNLNVITDAGFYPDDQAARLK